MATKENFVINWWAETTTGMLVNEMAKRHGQTSLSTGEVVDGLCKARGGISDVPGTAALLEHAAEIEAALGKAGLHRTGDRWHYTDPKAKPKPAPAHKPA